MPTLHSLWAATSKAKRKTKAFIVIIMPAPAGNSRKKHPGQGAQFLLSQNDVHHMCIYIYIYIYRKSETDTIPIYIYVYIYVYIQMTYIYM